MVQRHIFPLFLMSILALWPSRPATADDGPPLPEQAGFLSLTVENDVFFGGTDRHFTSGIRFDWVPKKKRRVFGLVPLIERVLGVPEEGGPNQKRSRMYFSLGQNIFTPDDITVPEIIPDDRPFAGWLYLSTGVVAKQDGYSERLELTLGVIGPASLAGDFQRTWHDWFNFRTPRGWRNQLKNEPGLMIYYERQWRLGLGRARKLSAELLPHVGISAGNVLTYASTGLSLRYGQNMPDDSGPPRIRPGLPGGAGFNLTEGAEYGWYIFASLEGRAVARNVFLDGSTFRKSHSVPKKHFVGDLNLGFAVVLRDGSGFLPPMRISYTHMWRSREFHGQENIDRLGSLSLTFRL